MAGLGFPRRLVVLGSTGSIGRQALDVARAAGESFTVVGLAAGHVSEALLDQVAEFGSAWVGAARSGGRTPPATSGVPGAVLLEGPDAAVRVIEMAGPDLVVDAICGFAGLRPAIAALDRGCLVAMAAKEAIVAGGHLLRRAAERGGGQLVPVDGEPRAVLECLRGEGAREELRRIYLTASGGPFWRRPRREYERATPAEALRHPCWAMGPKISVDSATMFNKGLEVIEISCLLGLPIDLIEVVVQPESVVHSLVEFADGSILAQLGPRDMRIPIAQAMFHPRRAPDAPSRLALDGLSLRFEHPEADDWPCLQVAVAAGRLGGTMPAAVSATDEELVGAFLEGRIGLGAVGRGLEAAFEAHAPAVQRAGPVPSYEELLAADGWARGFARRWCASEARPPSGRKEKAPR